MQLRVLGSIGCRNDDCPRREYNGCGTAPWKSTSRRVRNCAAGRDMAIGDGKLRCAASCVWHFCKSRLVNGSDDINKLESVWNRGSELSVLLQGHVCMFGENGSCLGKCVSSAGKISNILVRREARVSSATYRSC